MLATFPLLLAAALQVPQAAPRATPLPAAPRSASPAYDSVVSAVSQIGVAVAEVKSGLELYRRASFNEPDGELLRWAEQFGRSCRQLTQTVERQQPKLCSNCLPTDAQRAIDRYRAYMPTLARMGRDCGTRLQRTSASTPADSVPARLRRDARPVGNKVVEAIRPYEDRLQQVRIAFGWQPPPTPAPSPR
jgi:hypothetical protein